MIEIPERYFIYFIKNGSVKTCRKGEIIYFQNDSADSLYLILKGKVRVFHISASGKEITLEILEKGRIFGESSFLGEHKRPTTVEAVNTVELVSCNIKNLVPVLRKSEELMVLMFQHLSQTCNYLSNQIYRLTNYDRYQKIASFLLEETFDSRADKRTEEYVVPYTHEEIASLLGMNRVTVSKVLASFAEQGVIRSEYGRTIILDKKKLEDRMV